MRASRRAPCNNLIKTLTGHRIHVDSVALDADIIVTGSLAIKVWDRKNNYNLIKTLTGHTGSIDSVALDDDIIVSGNSGKTITVWGPQEQLPVN